MIKGVSSYIRFSISIYEQSIHNINYKMQCIPVVIVINSIILCHKMKANKYRDLQVLLHAGRGNMLYTLIYTNH